MTNPQENPPILLTAEAILKADDITRERVDVPEWGGSVYVRGLTARQKDRIELGHMNKEIKDYRATVAAYSICDDKGNALFSVHDIAKLADKSGAALERVFETAMRLSRITETDVAAIEGN